MFLVANVLIPSIAGHVIIMLFLLVPIALIEGFVLAIRLSLKYGEANHLSFRANLWSTVVGLPIGYACAMVGIIPAGIFANYLPEGIRSVVGGILRNALLSGGADSNRLDELGFWLGPLLVMVPYYLVTLRLERSSIAKRRPDLDRVRLTTTVRIMNGVTYGLLAIPLVIGAIRAAMKVA